MISVFIVIGVFLLIRQIINKKKVNQKLFVALVFAVAAEFALLPAYIANLSFSMEDLCRQKELVAEIEEQIVTLATNFKYSDEDANAIEFIDEYNTLNNRLAEEKSELARYERLIQPNNSGRRLARILLDFGIIEKLFFQ